MNRTCLFLLFASLIAAASATEHTRCYNYFMQKDKCVYSSADGRHRCGAPPKTQSAPVSMFALGSSHSNKPHPPRLARRYDTIHPPFPIGGGTGICGFYNSTAEIGVCLWSGNEMDVTTAGSAGWLNSQKKSNCGKRVFIQRTGQPNTVQYAKVLDGCNFEAHDPKDGCFQVGITVDLFNRFNPSKEEITQQKIRGGLTWDFDNLHGQSPQQGPV